MKTSLRIAYQDTRASELSWDLDLAPIDPLAALDVLLDGVQLQLRLLGSSHQVVVETSIGQGIETVACIPGRTGGLPTTAARRLCGWDYAFAALVRSSGETEFLAGVDQLERSVEAHPHVLVGTFPGTAGALTAVVVEREGTASAPIVSWSTWHTYPQTCEIVATRTWLTPPL